MKRETRDRLHRQGVRPGQVLRCGILVMAFSLLGSAPVAATDFIRSDSSQDSVLNIADAIYTLNHLTGGGPLACEDAADANDDGAVDIVDPVYTLHILFAGLALPQAPFPNCGADPTPDALGCATPICP